MRREFLYSRYLGYEFGVQWQRMKVAESMSSLSRADKIGEVSDKVSKP